VQRVAVVIPNWNGSARLAALFQCLGKQSHPIHQMIVSDNGSTDDSVAVAKHAGAQVIEMERNTGFSHAVNCGIRSAQAEWIAVLNNDVSPHVDWLAHLVAKGQHDNVWFATGKLLDARCHDRLDGAFDAICRGASAWRCGHGRRDSAVWNQPRRILFPPLTAALIRAELFERVGLLDEQFESYLEDIDFGIRCATGGFTGIYVPEAVAYHEGSATLGRWHHDTVQRIARNQLLLVAKHYPRGWVIRYGWPILVAQGLWGLTALRHGAFLAYIRGKMEGLARFRQSRGTAGDNFPSVIEQSEIEIRQLQHLTGFDLYWRLYFALT